ncbi:SagB family peptide dehydrogenase [Nostoc sp.]|uniref:SagB family peptide dehydrogenase n=1 Tax=Nostoc sp. TaxID=1180 RepID=UPI002FFB36BF
MPSEFLVSFREDICLIQPTQNEQFILQSGERKLTFKNAQTGLKIALKTLKTGGATLSHLKNTIHENDGFEALQKFHYYLKKFASLGWLCYSVLSDKTKIATVIPLTSDFEFTVQKVPVEAKYVLSRFAYSHQVAGKTLLESPLSFAQIILDWRGAALIAALSTPQNISQLSAEIPGISSETAEQFISLLFISKMLFQVAENDNIDESENTTLAQWEFHDLLFHTRSRVGRHANPTDGTFRFLGKIEPLPAVKPPMLGDLINLYKPDLDNLKLIDIPFTQVLEKRKSIREWGEKPITLHQLGEFLYRSARIKYIFPSEFGEVRSRPYPSGGAIYELEIYPVVNICQGLDSGLYHYRPESHQLCRQSLQNEAVEMLLKDAGMSMGVDGMPPILLVISARFQRIAWKYESIAYALLLKHVGVLYQTMYLVATAMNLAPCGLGGGNSDLFVKAVGCDYYAETSVGEFALGSC